MAEVEFWTKIVLTVMLVSVFGVIIYDIVKERFYMANKDLDVGSRVFLKIGDKVREYEITKIHIPEWSDGYMPEVCAKCLSSGYGSQESKFFLEDFLTDLKEAQDMKIRDIER